MATVFLQFAGYVITNLQTRQTCHLAIEILEDSQCLSNNFITGIVEDLVG